MIWPFGGPPATAPRAAMPFGNGNIARRCRQARGVWNAEGFEGIVQRGRLQLGRWILPRRSLLPVRPADVLAADAGIATQARTSVAAGDGPILVNWVMTPPSPGSGGHTTIFRVIAYLEAHGYANRIYFYDVYRGDHRYYASIVRDYYRFDGPVEALGAGMQDADAVVATAWPTAYPVFNACCAGRRFYFVQDFEPYFHPSGSASLMAENTYRMGFQAITAGRWLADKLRAEYDMQADAFELGCDVGCYHRVPEARRDGVLFHARPDAARRGLELGLLALELFARRRPDIPIHLVGQRVGRLPFRAIDHGHVAPAALNLLYNGCIAGLSLSFTNASLVPLEMLAAGCIPVVNEAEQNRAVLRNAFIRYAKPTPQALAQALTALTLSPDDEDRAQAAAASVVTRRWEDAGATVDRIFRSSLRPVRVLMTCS